MESLVANNLRMWRDNSGLTQEKIASFLNISRENISYYETGEREVPIKHLEKLADLYGIAPELFFEENKDVQRIEMATAFRTNEDLSVETLASIARFKKIARNYQFMKKKVDLL